MLSFDVNLDGRSWEQIELFMQGSGLWDVLMHDGLSEELAKAAKEHMKPLTYVRPQHTGAFGDSIQWDINESGSGFDIEFTGMLYGLWVDTGNFPASATITRASGGYFPIRAYRGGPAMAFSKTIHGMGSQNSKAPTHYSEKTAKWLAQDTGSKLMLEHLESWLGSVVL